MEIIDHTIFKTKMAIKPLGRFINGMDQNRSRANFLRSTSASQQCIFQQCRPQPLALFGFVHG